MPDHTTIADFRRDNGPAIRKTCAQFVELCRRIGTLKGDCVAIDGSKFKAINNRDRNFTKGKIASRLAHLEGVVAQLMPEALWPLSPSASGHADDLSGAERIEAVDEGDADLDFGSMMAAWQRRVSYAPSAVTVPISSPSGIWLSNSGKIGLSSSMLGMNFTARMSDVAASMARCTLRH